MYKASKRPPIETNTIWKTDDLIAERYGKNIKLTNMDFSINEPPPEIVVIDEELNVFARHWLDLQGYDFTKRVKQPLIKKDALWQDEHIEICPLDGFDDTYMIASVTNPERYVFVTDEQLKACNEAVQNREPEIAPCPFCKGECERYRSNYVQIRCIDTVHCGYHSGKAVTTPEAIRLHNRIAERVSREVNHKC